MMRGREGCRYTVRRPHHAGVVQWQNASFPSSKRGFDSPHPLRRKPDSLAWGDGDSPTAEQLRPPDLDLGCRAERHRSPPGQPASPRVMRIQRYSSTILAGEEDG